MSLSEGPPQKHSSPQRPISPRKPTKHVKPFNAFAEELNIHHTTSTERNGTRHRGSMGLFDDPDEIEAAERRRERHELEHHKTRIRRMQRQDERDHLKQKKEAKRIAKGKSPKPWYSRAFEKGRAEKGEARLAGPHAGDGKKPGEASMGGSSRKEYTYVVVRRPSTPEVLYSDDDVTPVDSPWLEACGMVRVRSDDRGGCHIVSKSDIQNSEKKQQ
ncbi:hypothetical protein J1614_006653 [Plenodomus biglobosus]|nr:hypothetical protein J1614_006653 [Plenodomus biglobosus]